MFPTGIGHAGGILLPAVTKAYYTKASIPMVYGALYTVSSIGTIAGPYAAGAAVDQLDYTAGIGIIEATVVFAVVALALAYYTWSKGATAASSTGTTTA